MVCTILFIGNVQNRQIHPGRNEPLVAGGREVGGKPEWGGELLMSMDFGGRAMKQTL